MKKKYLILILLYSLVVQSIAEAVDYYPEMGVDPFYSSPNPMVEQEEENYNEHDTLFGLFKKKKHDKNLKNNSQKNVTSNTDNQENVVDVQDNVNTEEINTKNETPKDDETLKETETSSEAQTINNAETTKDSEITEASQINQNQKNEEEEFPTVNVKNEESSNKTEGILETSDENFVNPPPKKYLTKKDLEKALIEEERENKRAIEREIDKQNREKLKEKLFFFKKKSNKGNEEAVKVDPNIILTADYMEYFPDRFEVEAIGNARVLFKAQQTTLSANKIIFNYDRNVIKANENVILTSPGAVTEGDFLKLDLSQPNGWVENPVTKTDDIQLSAKEAFLYSDKIQEYDGVAKVLRNDILALGGSSFANYLNPERVYRSHESMLSEEAKGVYKIKANKIIIDSKDDHEVITINNADLYLKNYRIAALPSIKIVTNKEHASAETNIPEFGSQSMLGMHIGPAVVLNVPGGSTLKLAPIVTYKDDKFGIGGIARFRNQYNMTEVAYGTSKDELVIRGRHKLAPGWMLNYSRLTNQNEWFLGYRMPKYSAQITYSRSDYVKDLKLSFSQKFMAGAFVDRDTRRKKYDLSDARWRYRWLTQTYKPVFGYENEEGNIGVSAGLVAQTAATVYSTGDTVGLFRVGPAVKTKLGPWRQAFMYFNTASAGESPFAFDRYRYGRSNFVLLENIKVCKYLTVGYLASLAVNSDYDDKTFQESRIMIGIGPEYAKFVLGYDARRRNAMVNLLMLVGTKDSDIEFKKSELINPDKFGKEKDKHKKKKKRNYKKFLKDDEPIVLDEE